MPTYKVLEKGFYDGRVYEPTGKRSVLHTNKPLKPVPAWLEAVKSETAAQKKKRLATEKKQVTADKKKKASDQKDIDNLTFMGAGEKTSDVETL